MSRNIAKKYICTMLLAVASLIYNIYSLPVSADERQYKVEAAFLYNFFNYIAWPGYDSPQKLQKAVICVLSGDPIIPYLEYARNRVSSERSVIIRSLNSSDSSEGCHLIFIRHRIIDSLTREIPDDALIVFKPDDPLDRGGMIELAEDGERIAIKINQEILERNGFQVSSRLLELAQKVR